MESEAETRTLECDLDKVEILKYSEDLANATQDKNEAEQKKKDLSSQFNATLAKHDADIAVLARKITTKKEFREVECYWSFDFDKGEKLLFRKDTMEIVETKKTTSEDRQRSMQLEETK